MARGLLLATCVFLVAAPTDASARPGGGSTFGSGRSSSGSSSSGSSSGSSSRSSWSSSGSSGSSRSSSSGSSSKSGESQPVAIDWIAVAGKSRAVVAHPGGVSPYGTAPERPASTKVTGYDERSALLVGLSFLGLVGLVVSGGFLGSVALFVRRRLRPKAWSTHAVRPALSVATVSPRTQLAILRQTDPDFSIVVFEDFVYALYAELHTARGARRLDAWSAHLAANARVDLERLGPAPVSTVVIGAMSYDGVSHSPSLGSSVCLQIEANYTESPAGAAPQSYFGAERWELVRGPHARSRPPDRARVFTCPSCGAPLERVMGGTCDYCKQAVNTGAFDWMVSRIDVLAREPRPPMLTGTTEEQGSELPTRYDAGLMQAQAALKQRDPSFEEQSLLARVGLIFATMQTAWTSLAWELARPYLSDNLWNAQIYWIEAYRRSGLRNVTQNARIVGLELVRITSDRWYDAVTLRLHANGLDYTLRDADGAVVGGNTSRERAYTEYWTLIRATGAHGRARTEPVCPSCGAPLAINAAGHCAHCQVKVTSGQFDWVLSRIEQDETYVG
jgi:hypothetical protein